MDNKSVTPAEADPTVIEATTHLEEVRREQKDDLEKHKKDMDEKKISDVMEILQGLSDRLKTIQENMDCRLQKMEERMDLLISSISEKAEADNMSIDESSFGQESDQSIAMTVYFVSSSDVVVVLMLVVVLPAGVVAAKATVAIVEVMVREEKRPIFPAQIRRLSSTF
ncbi:hypothetical protein BRARA_C04155 [Brassica rapa]|uniref:Uncharacterized protein n=1 Tax=Brassica campestris TaxID=3711 RepID=A0A398A6G1_BRACM|nr:hypothetical protein BRARA_C04155 [Brassica rapa]